MSGGSKPKLGGSRPSGPRAAPSSWIARQPPGFAAWLLLLIVSVFSISLIDLTLLELKAHFVTGGFLALYSLRVPGLAGAYLCISILLDASAVLACWCAAIPFLKRMRLTPVQTWATTGLLGVAVPFTFAFVRYNLVRYFGDLVDFRALLDLAGGLPREMLAQGSSHLVPIGAMVVAVALGAALVIRLLGHVEGNEARFTPPGARALAVWLAGCSMAAVMLLPITCLQSDTFCHGLRRKASGSVYSAIIGYATDFDLDGYGWISKPRDPDLFDSRIHPYALDFPGNGIDENGVGGDHPLDFRFEATKPDEARWRRTPHVLLILLESFRADLLERELHGRPITPFIDQIATEGGRSDAAYSNTPYTAPARAQLFTGDLSPAPTSSTLLDDFRRHGYYLAHFSAQDDSFGGSEYQLDYEEADVYYDARDDADLRVSRFTSPGSLAVSWKLLNRRIEAFLDDWVGGKPLFLYVNYHDTHFPYWHSEMDNILDVEILERHQISSQNRELLWPTYANAAANVDRAIGKLVSSWRQRLGDEPHMILITADHGESLFDDDLLGHGLFISTIETRVPLVLWGVGGDWPEPLGLSDLRGLLQQRISVDREGPDPPQPTFDRSDPDRKILQYVARVDRPRVIGWRWVDASLQYDFRTARFTTEPGSTDTSRFRGARANELEASLIWSWEAVLQTRRHQTHEDSPQ